MQHLENVFD